MTRLHERLARLTEGGVPAVLDPGPLPFDEADLYRAIRRAATETRGSTKREYLDGLRRLLARLSDQAALEAPWRAQFEASAYALHGFAFIGYRGNATLIDAADYLPRDGHGSFDDYLGWLGEQDDEIGYQTPGIQVASPRLATALRTLVKGCLPAGATARSYMNSFYGTYRATPSGVHVDPHHAHSFQVVLRGTRELWCWDARHVARLPHPEHLLGVTRPAETDFAIPPVRLSVAAGGIAYWPGHYAHCMVADGPSVAVTLVVEVVPDDPHEVVQAMARSLAASNAAASRRSGLPAVHDVSDALEVLRLILRSMGARIAVCAPSLVPLPAGALRSRLDPDFPMAHARLGDGRLLVGINGLVFEAPGGIGESDLRRLVDHLNAVERTSLDRLCASRSIGALGREPLARVLRMALTADAFCAA